MEHVSLDLTGLVRKTGASPFARGGFADIWMGELSWLITAPVQKVRTPPVAVKVPHVTMKHMRGTERQEIERRLDRELKTWRNLQHPNILPLLGTCTDLGVFPFALPLPSMITEYCPLGTLADYLAAGEERIDDLAMIHDIASAVVYMHERDPAVVHGDLKAENILISQNRTPRISDFGLSRAVKSSDVPTGYTTSTFHGSLRWMSPELHEPDENGRPPPFSIASDIWAFGMVILEIETHDIPWAHLVSDSAVMLGVMRGKTPPPPKNVIILPALWTLMQDCWKQNPAERVSMQDLMARVDLMKFQRDVQDPSQPFPFNPCSTANKSAGSPAGQRSLSSTRSSRSSSFLSSPATSTISLEPSIAEAETTLARARRAYTQRDAPLARQLYSAAAASFGSASNSARHAQTLTELARVDRPNARKHLNHAMEILSAAHYPRLQIRVQCMMAELEPAGEAKRLLWDARAAAKRGDWIDEEGQALLALGQVHVAAGEDDEALGWFNDALRLGERHDKMPIIADALEGRGGVYMRMGDKDAAAADLGRAADSYRLCGGGGKRGATRVLGKIRDMSGDSSGGSVGESMSGSIMGLSLNDIPEAIQ
ncbi:Serine/threonine-protein kinase [Ceratobasidium sp. AG-Ba]|nr:Serine/threonine-protein kinase [Ceratobasidium sp. AG-Ba]